MALVSGKRVEKFAGGGLLSVGIAALAVCIQGGIAVAASGYARPGRTGQGGTDLLKQNDAAGYRALGVFTVSKTGGAADGDVSIEIETGTFLFKNSAGVDAITQLQLGHYCFIVDDETVARRSAGNTRARAGVVKEVSAEGVWVELGATIAGAGERRVFLPFAINETDTLAGTSAELISPVAGNIVKMGVVVQKAVTTGGDVTALVGVTAVAGLACTIADAATKGTVVEDTPTLGDASTVVAIGSRIQIAPAAAFNTAGAVSGYLEIAY